MNSEQVKPTPRHNIVKLQKPNTKKILRAETEITTYQQGKNYSNENMFVFF